ncbi:hypothetical protein CBE01nite_24420 [Clostridium beijerinckii]|uniref:DUF5050 domain-containing protein n=1 Tax=Clostridium beijerinckii TaxID=1520 RepID=A0AB74V9A2_CLOBE|nr:DUF5050 domain-containing protein [Clostridium beijerinckii]NRZ27150.1 hypothetical protein [Clostridium beijerinckii]NYB97054.1 hypothetical protein [Clostridium beijerinckii]OOM21077.1 hypothetical protein CLBEI_40330 [Clostridium beijerinckii]QUN33019.1 DUF5050 domain-containing protein [Clostridium beijerinckii]SQB21149.1 serine/threonine protein kinase [Clostridium beijerinckii]
MSKKVINRLFSVITITSLIFMTCSTSAKADTTETDFSHTDFGTISGLSIEKQNPYVEYAGVDHYPVLSGDTIKINMSSKYDGDYSDYSNYDPVQYRVFIARSENEDYTELTDGYSNPIPAYNEFTIEDNNALTEGKYKVMIFVKRSSSNGADQNSYGAYDKIYNFNFTCYNSLDVPKNDDSKISNSSGNIVNDGMAVEDNDYIYYINRVGDVYGAAPDYLYKIRKNDPPRKDICDLSYNTQLIPNRVWNLNLVDDWIYYSNWKDAFHHSINKVKTDGTEDTCIANEAVGNMFVEGNWIYYVKRTNSHSIDLNNIYKISLDGSCRIRLNSSATEDMTASNGWIYYTNISDGYKIYRMRLDGSENTKVCDDETLFITVCGDTVFYSNKSDSDKLYKVNGDGTGKAKLSNDKATFINASKDYVYYVNYSDNENLYKIPVGGGRSEKITNEYGANITILEDKIFFNGMFYDK